MAKVEKLSIALTPELASTVREAISSGQYASASELMREALREWQQRRIERERAITELRRLWDEGIESGSSIPGKEAFETLLRKYESAPPKLTP
jgi:antitoxin ParD1/3/4